MMGKPISKSKWEEIKKDFESGMSQAELRKKYNLSPSTLGSKIKREGWKLSQEQNIALKAFKDASANVSKEFEKANEMQKSELIYRVQTIIEDNELISNNRKIAKLLQSVIVQSRNDITLNNIKQVSGTLRDIESIANPKNDTSINIQNTNAIQNNLTLKDFYEE